MRLSSQKVILVELTDAHNEGIVSWHSTLVKEGAEVTLAADSKLLRRCEIPDASHVVLNMRDGWLRRIFSLRKLVKHIASNGIKNIVVNTAAGTSVRDFLWLLPRGLNVIGIIHNIGRVGVSSTQKWIEKRLSAYVVISPHLLVALEKSTIPVHVIPQTAIPSESEIHGDGSGTVIDSCLIEKTEHEYWVVIPGHIEGLRKDYTSLLNPVSMSKLPKQLKLIFLGNSSGDRQDRVEFRQSAEQYPEQCIWFDRYVSHNDFHGYLKQADLVLPLMHPNCHEYAEFMTIKSSGSFSMAWSYTKPMLLEAGFAIFPALHYGTRFYQVEQLTDAIVQHFEQRQAAAEVRAVPWDSVYRQDATVRVIQEPQSPLPIKYE